MFSLVEVNIYCILQCIFTITSVTSDRILFVLPIATQSHKNVFDPLVLALAARGHSITVIGPFHSKYKLPSNVHEIVPLTRGSFKDDFKWSPLQMRRQGSHRNVVFFGTDMSRKCEETYEHPEIQNLLKSGQFDLIFINGYFNQCFWGLAPHFQAPFILVTTMASPLFITKFTGNFYPTSFVPLPFLNLTDRMTFTNRLWNFVGTHLADYLTERKTGTNEGIYRKYLGQHLPSLHEIGVNVSLIMSNEHFALTYPRPNLVDTIPIGGIHCREANPLPKDLNDFLSEADSGFIYFSLGSIIESTHLPEETLRMFINVFSRLKQRVIWKWDNDTMADIPKNVKISKWLPQQDILGHSNIKLFITHGGLLSSLEAVFHGVPLMGIPIIVDQDLNMQHAESQGYALTIEILEITEAFFESTIHRLLDESRFADKAKQLSIIFRDQMKSPLETGIYWSEYVLRHRGAFHLQSAARQLNIVQFHSLDVITFISAVSAFVMILMFCGCSKIVQKMRQSVIRGKKLKLQ